MNTSSFPDVSAFLALPSDLGAIEHWTYAIPHTTLLLRMGAYPAHAIDRAALGRTILAAQVRVRAHLKKHGDGELWEGDDRKFSPSASTPSNYLFPLQNIPLDLYFIREIFCTFKLFCNVALSSYFMLLIPLSLPPPQHPNLTLAHNQHSKPPSTSPGAASSASPPPT